ncbi:hypothetical protein HanXRQr2_Chr07g0287611 [Helianthus annuus]|uniref:Uncharacterized protein n=1 Tax=Helianthus annuus TaxID=4232 RepID=A0A9K3NF34_HELAN|nr:hypothetical protein HanXRQr2_Chr07g0287611 [Helianthus annuus]KAJ0904135.1 hypothetical protein HanPSC8_Chr07g0278441 [Helianthus annuus]
MSARYNAGASFTPSPVIPHICFRSCSFLTISYLKYIIFSNKFTPASSSRTTNVVDIFSHLP